MGQNSLSRIAYGTINPFTFVQGGTGYQQGAWQATGGAAPIIGIAPEWTNAMMGTGVQLAMSPQGYPAAVSGQSIRVYEDGEDCQLMIGSGQTIMPDMLLRSDASGYGIAVSAAVGNQQVGARAIEPGVAGDIIRVQCYTRAYNSATS